MPRTYIIGDIHGCCNTFQRLVLDEIRLRKSDKLYCLGDYIDRGPDSKGVIDFILSLRKKGYRVHTLRGNHEQMLLNSTKSDKAYFHWIKNGGDKTLESYRVGSIDEIEPAHLNFFKNTKHYFQSAEYILVHAGLNFEKVNPFKDKNAMLWIRNFPVDMNFLNGRLLIHGHTYQTSDYIINQAFDGAVNLDGGCVYTHKEGCGSLFALDLSARKFIEVGNIG